MHYQNGREVKIGDRVVGLVDNQKNATGIVLDVIEACNLRISVFQYANDVWGESGKATNTPVLGAPLVAAYPDGAVIVVQTIYGTAKEFIHVEDLPEHAVQTFLTNTATDESQSERGKSFLESGKYALGNLQWTADSAGIYWTAELIDKATSVRKGMTGTFYEGQTDPVTGVFTRVSRNDQIAELTRLGFDISSMEDFNLLGARVNVGTLA